MKTILLLFGLLFTVSSFSQSVLPQGSSTQVVRYRGGIMTDSILILPIRNAAHPAGYSNTTAKGTILFDKNDSLIKYGNGNQFTTLLTVPKAAQLYFPIPVGSAPQYLNGLGVPTTFPAYVLSSREIAVSFNGVPVTQDLSANCSFDLTEGDSLITNEGSLTVTPGTVGTSEINSNTSGSIPVILAAGDGVQISEVGNTITIATTASISDPAASNAIVMGTAFQPNSSGPCYVSVNGQLTGALGLNETVTIAISPTQNGTYVNIATDVLLIGLLGVSLSKSCASFPVKTGQWVRVTRSGSAATATYTRWDL